MSPPPLLELVDRVVGSATFARTERHRQLLEFLATRPDGVDWKETSIGHHVFRRPVDYDPKADPIVRVEMRRLRERLEQYYAAEGSREPWRLEIPKGSYALQIGQGAPPAEPAAEAAVPAAGRRGWAAAAVLAGLALAGAFLLLRRPGEIRSIAVAPFVAEARLGIPGLEDEVAGALTRLPGGLTVTRASAGGDAVLSGQVEAQDGRVRLRARLERDQAVIWARSFERDLVDRFALQEELAATVAGEIHREVLKRPGAQRPAAPASAEAARRGWALVERRSEPALREAVEVFRQAARLDSANADAWTGLCEAIAMAPDYMPSPAAWTDEGRAAGRRALELSPANPAALAALGWLEFSRDLRAARAEKLLKQAIALDPRYLTARRRLGLLLMSLGRFREAEQQIRTVMRLDPLSLIARINLAEIYGYQGAYAEEEQVLTSVLRDQPNFVLARMMLASEKALTGQCAAARRLIALLREEPDAAGWQWPLLSFEARCGEKTAARRALAQQAPSGPLWALAWAVGDIERTAAALELLAREQASSALTVAIGPERRELDRYPAIAAVFVRLEERLHRPDPGSP